MTPPLTSSARGRRYRPRAGTVRIRPCRLPDTLRRRDRYHAIDPFTAHHATPLLTAQVEHAVAAQGDRMQWIEARLAAARVITARLATYSVSHAARQIGWIASAVDLDAPTITNELTNAYCGIADRGHPIGRLALDNTHVDL